MLPKRVLIVEDDADGASILEAYLRKDGFEVAVAEDGARGLALFRQWSPQIVLLDMMLPKLSGPELLSEIRRNHNTPVIMVTAIGDEPDKIGALRYGADDYVVKPCNPVRWSPGCMPCCAATARPPPPSNASSAPGCGWTTNASSPECARPTATRRFWT